MSLLREFGCKVLCLDTRPNSGKLDPKTKEGTFIGYSDTSKAYRVWFTNDRSVQVVRDIKFLKERLSPLEVQKQTKLKNSPIEFYETAPDEVSDENDDDPIEPLEEPRDPHEVPTELQELPEEGEVEPDTSPKEAVKRGRGAPRIERTGKPVDLRRSIIWFL